MKNKDFDSFNNDRINALRKRIDELIFLKNSWEKQGKSTKTSNSSYIQTNKNHNLVANGRTSKNEHEFRVNKVAKLLSVGTTRSDIIHFGSSEWGVSQRTVENYIQTARGILKQDFDVDRRQFTAEVLAQYASLQKEARKSGQLTVALGCINSMAKVGQVMS